MIVPDQAVKFILFQRTEYLVYQNNRLLNSLIIRLPFLTYNRMVAFEAWLFKNRIKHLFSEDMEREYETIKHSLPAHPLAILDIGAGMAGIDVMLHRHYAQHNSGPVFYLLDKTELNPSVYYGIEKVAAYYNSFEQARELLSANGVDPAKVHTQEVSGAPIFPSVQFDLIISLISWGFHYPVETYLDEAYDKLKPGGVLILDIRRNTGGEALLSKKFGDLKILKEAKKYRRFSAIK